MRCGCPECGTYMIQSESLQIACVCPDCGMRCNACMGTNSVISREDLLKMKSTEWFTHDEKPSEEDEPIPARMRPAED